MFGNSAVAGIGLEECDYSPSALQALLNQTEKAVKVLNLGVDGQNFSQLAYRITDSYIEPNSVIVVVMCIHAEFQFLLKNLFEKNHIPYCATIEYFQRPHQLGEVFFNAHHLNHNGNKKIAEIIYEKLFLPGHCAVVSPVHTVQCYSSLSEQPVILEEYYNPIAQSEEFRNYIQMIARESKRSLANVGAIVMNCNPFTLGHQYLIEVCASKVDWLYIFVVEEDRSVFSFSDRLKLVKQGVAHLSNISVFPSGSFMISTLTFPEYFRKDDLKELKIDPSADVELFGKYIAPSLGITVRFAGEEPLDAVTAQYNAAMERLLPKFGIAFQEIPRKASDGMVISASRVRALMQQGDFIGIEKLVPQTTMEHLIENHLPQIVANVEPEDYDKMLSILLTMVSSGKYSHMPCIANCLQYLTGESVLLSGISDLDFISYYQDIYWMLWQKNNADVLDIMTGMLLDDGVRVAEETFLTVYLNIAALEEQIPAFLFGKIRLAQFYMREQCIGKCREMVDDLIEMGAGSHEDVVLLQQKLKKL